MFQRIAVVNRGEAAVRLIRAVNELNEQFGYAIATVALHTEAERGAMFVRLADEAVCLRNTTAASPYLDHHELERALRESRADAVWVGWGFVAEDPAFAELCKSVGATFIGPTPEVMRRLGDKIEAKLAAETVGVPVAAWSGGVVDTVDEAREHAERIGYPLIVKARSGGGGRGIRIVHTEDELAYALTGAQADGERYFGDSAVFIEKLVSGGRHVEVQVIADQYGAVWTPGVRDCSVQRRNQKLLEESNSPVLTAQQTQDLKAAAARLVADVGYQGAGTVEFLYDPRTQEFAFLEVNTRLQVEHPVTEVTTGLDLVKLQIHVAAGGALDSAGPPAETGHAIEARLNAEDPDRGFVAAPGRIDLLALPAGPGVRVDTGYAAGDEISPDYDSMVAKIIAYGNSRDEAIARLRRALRDTLVVVNGGTTNKSLLLDLLGRPEVLSGEADTAWLDRLGQSALPTPPFADIALIAAAIDVYDGDEAVERDAFFAAARGGRPHASHTIGRTVELRYGGQQYPLSVAQLGTGTYRVSLTGGHIDVTIERLGGFEGRLTVHGRHHHIVTAAGLVDHLIDVDGMTYRITRDEAGVIRAPAPAVVVAMRVAPGDEVAAGTTVAVLEAMKMETAVVAPVAGRVREVLATVNSQIPAGAALLRMDPKAVDTAAVETGSAVDFQLTPDTIQDPRTRAFSLLEGLRTLITGFDVDDDEARALVTEYVQVRGQLTVDDDELLHAEVDVLTIFTDICELSRNRPSQEEESSRERTRSPREYLHSYLRSLDPEREGLPEQFSAKLSRALRHYGVTDLTPTPQLHEAVYRGYLAQERTAAHTPVIIALLERWLADDVPGASRTFGDVLERLVVATQVRYPDVGDLARSIRFRLFDQPLLRRNRAEVFAKVREHLRYLDQTPNAADRDERIADMVASPEPLVRLLARQIDRPDADPSALLEVLTRRYYRDCQLADVKMLSDNMHALLVASCPRGHRRHETQARHDTMHVVATAADFAELPTMLRAALDTARGLPPGDVVLDVYLSWLDAPQTADETATALRQALNETIESGGLPGSVTRVTTSVVAFHGEALHRHFTFRAKETGTFRPGVDALDEDRVIRGLHPMLAQRLDLHLLANYDLTRLPSDEDVFLFRCVAKTDPSDERLVAMAQVRDLTPLRDATGEVIALPAAEGALAACTDAIRREHVQRPSRARPSTNRIFIYAWPPNELTVDELKGIVRRIVPTTGGAGIEEVLFLGRQRARGTGELRDTAFRISYQPGAGPVAEFIEPPREPLPALTAYDQKVRRAQARGSVYPYEIVPLLTRSNGEFVEYDLSDDGSLVPVDRPYGLNTAGIIVGVVTTPTATHPEGMRRVALFGDPTKALGTVAEAECHRIVAALDLAARLVVPVEWFTLSSGATISMDSGTENMDWVARALRSIVRFTQDGGEINVIVAGINVGAQPYWNAEATMLMHTKGILVMTPDSAMVLTGKQALDYSGGVSAEDNFGIGGYDRVMGPNGQAQYWAPNIAGACGVLFAHYDHTYVTPGESSPRRAATTDPVERDVREYPHTHPGSDFTTVGDIFSTSQNAERKKPFDIRTVMRAVADQDHDVLERWAGMADADTGVVFDAHLGGYPVSVVGVESRPIPRRGFLPADGPDQWTAGTLFPRSSKKVARAVNAASGNRPLVVLANLSGFDGSPESLRNLQLEYGAEIGRAIVNFDGPIVFCLISRYHGGAFVVFSGALNDNMEVVAVEGSYASVIGGAPAAAVVFTRDVSKRSKADPRIAELEAAIADAEPAEQAQLRMELSRLRSTVHSEKLGEVAAEFEAVHDIERARRVGSVHKIITASQLRPYLIGAVERGLRRHE